jgi:glucose/mannose-6-phosphate isomerase
LDFFTFVISDSGRSGNYPTSPKLTIHCFFLNITPHFKKTTTNIPITHIKQAPFTFPMVWKEKLRWVMQQVTGEEKQEGRQQNVFDTFSVARDHLKQGMKLSKNIAIENVSKLEHLTFVGMGGSLHPAFILQTYLKNIGYKKPINLVRDYSIPENVSRKGFLFVISYSGNTEETLHAYREGYRKGYRMIAISCGGKLKDMANQHGTTFVDLPTGYEPRHSFYFILGCLLQILQNSGVIVDLQKEVEHVDVMLRKDLFKTMGKQLADKLNGKLPLIYTTEKFGRVGERWKICLNENAKIHAFCNMLPEMNHNEINAFVEKRDDIHVILLADDRESERHAKRISVTKQIIQEQEYGVTEVVIKGPTYLSRIISAVHIGDWVSYYVGVNRGVDVLDVSIIERLKKLL